ncbi:hypothetical protein QOM21_28800 [Streptomyces sp. Pv4-95]|uniref:hypothetical protein n=1 Tax=Streptomyces sp. Pv4-95 TaxID=3049543 RepID=UPI00389120D9
MAKAVRKSEGESYPLEIFDIELGEGEWETLSADPEKFLRERLEPEFTVNGVCIDTRVLDHLSNDEDQVSFVRLVHIAGGPLESYYVFPQQM